MLVDNQEKKTKTENNPQDEFAKFFLHKIEKNCHNLMAHTSMKHPPEDAHFQGISGNDRISTNRTNKRYESNYM